MIYILLFTLLFFLYISYYINGKDFFSPGNVLTLTFIFSTISAFYNIKKWEFRISFFTFFVLISIVFISIIVNSIVHNIIKKNKNIEIDSSYYRITPINNSFSKLFIIVELLLILTMLFNIYRISGIGTFPEKMIDYRQKTAYSTDLKNMLPNVVRQLLNVSSTLCYIYIFDFIYFYDSSSTKHKVFDILVILFSIIASLLTGGRFSTMGTMIGAIVMWYFITMKKENKIYIINYKRLLKIIFVFIILFLAFYSIKSLIGRDSNYNIVDYITHYAGGSIPGLDLYFKEPPRKSNIVGKETFYSLINGLRKLKLINIDYYYIHHEFRRSNGNSIGNIYTAIRDYHYDFGLLGVYVLHSFFSLFMSVIYEKTKMNKKPFSIIVLSIMYYCLVFYPISNYFYANIISFGFCIKIIILLVFYQVLLEKRLFNNKLII